MSDELMKRLQRALFYEVQYRNAIVSDSFTFFDINLTNDLIENDFYIKDSSGNLISCLELVGLSAPASFSEFLKKWYEQQIPDENKSEQEFFKDARNLILESYNQGKLEYTTEYWSYTHTNQKIFINQKYYLTRLENGNIYALCVAKDFTDRKIKDKEKTKKELEEYAFQDAITGGYNYNKFKEKLSNLSIPGSIICLDIRSFKIVNSICGVATGDMVLKTIWECLMSTLDIKNNDMTAHINADHFIIYLPTDDKSVIVKKIKDISLALTLLSVELEVPTLQAYFGISKWIPGKRIELSYSEAVAAKHNSKDDQENNYSFFDEADTKRLINEKKMADAFADSLESGEFKIWYQPKYNPTTKKLVGAEALIRWHKADGSIVPPGEFIPLFERNGMIRVLDEYVFKNVCRQQKLWSSIGKKLVPVSINLSRASLYYKTIVNQYKLIAEDFGIDKSLIPLEITESAAVNDDTLKELAAQFYESGFRLHMDDFGSGYSSLASLNTMHFDTLKLDKSLIDYIGNFGGDRLLEHTIYLAKELGMHVTAEGVENANQVVFLKHLGCDSIQGYFYSKPVPQEEFELKLENEKSDDMEDSSNDVPEYIGLFKRNYFKPPVYTFAINVTQNKIVECSGNCDWQNEALQNSYTYSQTIDMIAKTRIPLEIQEKYLKFMNRETILNSFKGENFTRIEIFPRKMNGIISPVRILMHVFMVESSTDVWAYTTVTNHSFEIPAINLELKKA